MRLQNGQADNIDLRAAAAQVIESFTFVKPIKLTLNFRIPDFTTWAILPPRCLNL
jgi:hypothetical protein